MADNQYGLEAQWQLNRLAGTLDANKRPLYDIDEAANIWAGTVDLPLVAALNYKAGLTGFDRKDFVGVCNVLAGTTGLGAPAALARIPDALGTLGQDAVFWIDANLGGTVGQRVKNLGTAGSLLDVQVGSTGSAGLEVVPGSHIYLPGVAGNFLSVPDANNLDITGDIDLAVKVAMTDWTPSSQQTLCAKWGASGQRSYWLSVLTDGRLNFAWTADGSTILQTQSSVATGVTDGATKWVRATLDVDNGTSKYEVKFYTSDDGSTWTELGTSTVGSATTSIFNSTAVFEVGSDNSGFTRMANGTFYRTTVKNGIDGTKVLDVDCAQATTTSPTFTALTGQTVSINRTGADSNDPRWLLAEDTSYVYLPGVASNFLSVQDANALDITGDIDIRWYGAMDGWSGSNQDLLGKWDVNNLSFGLSVLTAGTLRLYWSTNGTASTFVTSTVATGVTNGTAKWVRATLDVDNGASGNDVKFFLSDDGVNWTQLGTTVTTAGTTSIYAGTANLIFGVGSIGSYSASKVYRAQVLNGINGTPVLDVDTSLINSGSATSFTARTGQTVTINRSSSGRKTVVVPSRTLEKVDDKHVYLPGVAGNYLSVPDSAQLDITGDIDVRVQVAMDDWTPATAALFAAKSTGSGNQQSWYFGMTTGGNLSFRWSTDGATLLSEVYSSVVVGVTDGMPKWVRVTLDVDNGASGRDVKFFTSDDGVTWTQLGTTQTTAGTTSIYSGTAVVEFGSRNAGTTISSAGKIYRGQVLNGIDGTLVLDVDAKDAPLNFTAGTANSFKAKTGQTVTMNSTSGSAMRVVDARSASGSSCWLFGTDDYMEVNNRWVDGTTKNVYLPGVAGNYMSVPDSAALDITGDIDIRVKVALDDWSPATEQVLLSKESGSATRSYRFQVSVGGAFGLVVSSDGSTQNSCTSNISNTFADGSMQWVRVTRQSSTGSVIFYTSTNGTTWTQFGATQTGSSGNIFTGSQAVEIGSRWSGTSLLASGEFFRAIIYSDLTETTKVLDVNAEASITSVSQTTFTEQSSNAATVTINRSGTGYVSTGVTESGYIYPTGTPNLTPAPVDLLNFGASDSFTVFAVVRMWNNPSGVHHTIVAKAFSTNTGFPGYMLYRPNGTATPRLQVNDLTFAPSSSQTIINGISSSIVGVRNVTSDTIGVSINSLPITTATDTTTGSINSSTNALRVGNRSSGSDYSDMEFVAAAIFRRALSVAEIKAISEYYARTVK